MYVCVYVCMYGWMYDIVYMYVCVPDVPVPVFACSSQGGGNGLVQ